LDSRDQSLLTAVSWCSVSGLFHNGAECFKYVRNLNIGNMRKDARAASICQTYICNLTFKGRMVNIYASCFDHQSLCILYSWVLNYSRFKRRLSPWTTLTSWSL
jgi:hypothetical protein